MKTLIVLLTLLFVNYAFAQEKDSFTITVIVENLKNDEGTVIVALYNEDNFLKSIPLRSSGSKIINGKAIITFEAVETGAYGITAFHDANGNQQMDFDTSGMPLEIYGISNNKFNPYGPPVWSDAKFELEEEPVEFNLRLTR